MSTTGTRTPQTPPGLLAAVGFFRLTVDEYHQMIRNNILTPEDRVELLDGYLVNKMPQNTPHSSTVDRLDEDFKGRVPPGWRVRMQLPITLAESEPEPDIAVVRGDRRTYSTRQPGPADFGIVVEVAESSLALDRGPKRDYYAAAAIPEYWVVDLVHGQVEVYAAPDTTLTPPAYTSCVTYQPGQSVPVSLDGQPLPPIPVADLLP